MPEEKKIQDADELVRSGVAKLFGSMGPATANPVGTALGAKPVTGKFRIEGRVLREDDSPMANISIGMMGTEVLTDAEGKFTLTVEKKRTS